jgi:hypothetical protein
MIIRNAPMASNIGWVREQNPRAVDIARRFLFGEIEILHLNRAQTSEVADIEGFLRISAEASATVERSEAGHILLRMTKRDETLMITGKTAVVLSAYLDNEPVRMADRFEMTQRRQITAADRVDRGS